MADRTPEQIALEKISENKRFERKELELSELGLTVLPKEIGSLTHLEELSLSENYLETLPDEIGKLVNLKTLYLKENRFSVFPEVICSLSQLEKLSLISNKLKALPIEMRALKNLKWLAMGNNFWTSDLQKADGENSYPQIPDVVWELCNLKDLYVTAADVISISPKIKQLAKLRGLYLTTNFISMFPKEIQELKSLSMLQIQNNPLGIPNEILEDSTKPSAIISYYFTFKSSEKKPLNTAKVLIIGQGSVGKTSLVRRIIRNEFDSNEIKTQGISIKYWAVANQLAPKDQQYKISLNMWDFGGQEIMHATHQFFLTKRSLYLLVLDSRLTQEENRVEYWLKIIQSFGGESPVLIVGNKIDQHLLDIDRTGLQKKYPNIVSILETSAATGAGIEELKAAITEQVNNLPHVRDLLPETWFTVKTKLEELGKQSNFITQEKYLDLCAENEVSDETSQRTLIGFLHDLGVVLHFQDDPRLEALGILNPQWVTNGVYKILNSHTLFQNKGVLTTSMLDEILDLPEYPRGKRLFIVDMMKKFELCYDIEPDKTFLVPDLLPKDEPAELKFNGVPAFEYAYPVLPSSVITRFIVRMNQKIENHFVWRTGVVLKIGENLALVKADIEDRKITIAIDGVEHTRRDALSAIRYQLDEIHGSIKGLDAQKRVPISEAPNSEPLDYDYLLQLEQDGFEEHPVKNGNRLVKVNVKKLLSGVVSETERRQSTGSVTNIYIGGDVNDGTIIAGDENRVA